MTNFNTRQEINFREQLTDSEFVGLRAMLEVELSRWIQNELTRVESLFPADDDPTLLDYYERIIMYLVSRYGTKLMHTDEIGIVVEDIGLNSILGKSARIEESNNQTVIIVK